MWNKHLVITLLIAISSLIIAWFPFFTHTKNILGIDFAGTGMDRIVQNFDGLNFLIVGKTGYDPAIIERDYQDVLSGRRSLYFSAHYPGLPLLIRGFDQVVSGPNAVLLSIIVSNILLAYGLYAFFSVYTQKPKIALWLATLALFFPARMLADRIVGSNESLFIFFVLMSLVMHMKNKAWQSGIFGALAVLTRSPGILLFGAYMAQLWLVSNVQLSEKIKRSLPYLLIPLSLIGLWIFYGWQFGSFWAYFQVGGNINLYWPFAVFASHMDWVNGIWNEDLIYLYLFILIGIGMFWQKHKNSAVALWGVLYTIFVLCIAHRDVARYSLPIIPLVLIGMSPLLENKLVKIVGIILIIPIFLYAWQFVLANYQPVADWSKFL